MCPWCACCPAQVSLSRPVHLTAPRLRAYLALAGFAGGTAGAVPLLYPAVEAFRLAMQVGAGGQALGQRGRGTSVAQMGAGGAVPVAGCCPGAVDGRSRNQLVGYGTLV